MNNFKNRLPLYFTLSIFLCGVNHFLDAQNSFTVSADTVFAIKPANYFVFYNYVEFGNNTADTLHMRWKKVETISDNPGEPGNIWDIAIQDHVNFYNPANFLDSADFYIPTITGSTDKFLLHLFPNDLPGNLVVKFQFYPIDNPAESQSVVFDYTAAEVVGVEDRFIENSFRFSPIPAAHFFHIFNQSAGNSLLSVFSAEGQMITSFSVDASEKKRVDCSGWPNGVYFVKITCGEKTGWKQIVVNNN